MSSKDANYARMRAVEERERASAAANPRIRAIHMELASKYDELAGNLNSAEETQLSRKAVGRSWALLKATGKLIQT